MGTITGISDLDPVRWKNSQWHNLQVNTYLMINSFDLRWDTLKRKETIDNIHVFLQVLLENIYIFALEML